MLCICADRNFRSLIMIFCSSYAKLFTSTWIAGRLADEELIWKTRWESKERMNTKYLLQSCSDVGIPVLHVSYLLISSNAYLSHRCSCVDNSQFFSLLNNFWRVDESSSAQWWSCFLCKKNTIYNNTYFKSWSRQSDTVVFYVYLQKLEKSDLDNWENIRGPQLWEDSRAVQKQRREAARLKTEWSSKPTLLPAEKVSGWTIFFFYSTVRNKHGRTVLLWAIHGSVYNSESNPKGTMLYEALCLHPFAQFHRLYVRVLNKKKNTNRKQQLIILLSISDFFFSISTIIV